MEATASQVCPLHMVKTSAPFMPALSLIRLLHIHLSTCTSFRYGGISYRYPSKPVGALDQAAQNSLMLLLSQYKYCWESGSKAGEVMEYLLCIPHTK